MVCHGDVGMLQHRDLLAPFGTASRLVAGTTVSHQRARLVTRSADLVFCDASGRYCITSTTLTSPAVCGLGQQGRSLERRTICTRSPVMSEYLDEWSSCRRLREDGKLGG